MTQRWQKLIRQLQQKKYRKQEGLFLVEGEKSVLEALASNWKVHSLQATDQFLSAHPSLANHSALSVTTPALLSKAGSMKTNDRALAILEMPDREAPALPQNGIVLALDEVKDPGNMGTILRIADWYGIQSIVCSQQAADLYNPKVINSSMGSFLRIPVYYTDLPSYLSEARKNQLPVLGALMDGESTHEFSYPHTGILVMGNESKGISEEVLPFISSRITIPRFGHAESLNVGVATAVICDRLASNAKNAN